MSTGNFPESFESANLSREYRGREIGRVTSRQASGRQCSVFGYTFDINPAAAVRRTPTDRKGTNGVSANGVTAIFSLFDRGIFWVLPLTYFYSLKSARAYLFPNLSKFICLQRPH